MISRLDAIKDWTALAGVASYCAMNLALCCGVSRRQLQRFFFSRMGLSPQAWLNALRQEAAVSLLNQAKSVKEIAFALGYKQPSHFSREFKRVYGVAPKAARLLRTQAHVAARYETSLQGTALELNATEDGASIKVHDNNSPSLSRKAGTEAKC